MNTTITAAIVALLIGFGSGFYVAGSTTLSSGTHTMSDGSTMSDTMAGMTAGLEGKTGDAFDRAFIDGMIEHHEGAVAMAQQALQKAQRSEIKQMANDIISAQTREITTMRGWLQLWYGVEDGN